MTHDLLWPGCLIFIYFILFYSWLLQRHHWWPMVSCGPWPGFLIFFILFLFCFYFNFIVNSFRGTTDDPWSYFILFYFSFYSWLLQRCHWWPMACNHLYDLMLKGLLNKGSHLTDLWQWVTPSHNDMTPDLMSASNDASQYQSLPHIIPDTSSLAAQNPTRDVLPKCTRVQLKCSHVESSLPMLITTWTKQMPFHSSLKLRSFSNFVMERFHGLQKSTISQRQTLKYSSQVEASTEIDVLLHFRMHWFMPKASKWMRVSSMLVLVC